MKSFFALLLLACCSSCYTPSGISRDSIDTDPVKKETDLPATDADGPRYETALRRGKPHGQWTSWYPSGQPCDAGSMINGIPDGEWKVWYTNGQIRYIRTYAALKYSRIKEELSKPVKYPLYQLTRIARQNRPAALKSLRPDEDLQTTGEPLPLLVQKNTWEQSGYYAVFSQCLLHGLYMNFAMDGTTLDSGYYNNGLRHGLWMSREGNIIARGIYRQGQKEQEWKYYDAAQRLQYIVLYKNGKEQYRKKFRDG